jgi:hypothetical protein
MNSKRLFRLNLEIFCRSTRTRPEGEPKLIPAHERGWHIGNVRARRGASRKPFLLRDLSRSVLHFLKDDQPMSTPEIHGDVDQLRKEWLNRVFKPQHLSRPRFGACI